MENAIGPVQKYLPLSCGSKLCVEHSLVIILFVEAGHCFSTGLENVEIFAIRSCKSYLANLVSEMLKYSL